MKPMTSMLSADGKTRIYQADETGGKPRFIGTNPMINKENYQRMLWLSENDPSWEGMNLADMVNSIIERYFARNGLDALIERERQGFTLYGEPTEAE